MAGAFGLLGEHLGHSYSPIIYRELAGLDYRLFEVAPDNVEDFVRQGDLAGFNVTIPYKRAVLPYVDELTPAARRMGNVNTVVRRSDGTLLGHNTDCYGFEVLAHSLGIDWAGKKALVLGMGGAGSTCRLVLDDLGARTVGVGRTLGKPGVDVTYDELDRHADAALIVNATPVGMYPDCPDAPLALDRFGRIEGVIDIVYNPARTGLLLEAERLGVPCAGGLLMLVAQAAGALELFTGERVPTGRIADLTARLSASEQNVALIGMPGAGKTRVGARLAALIGRAHVDVDWELERRLGCSCADYLRTRGETAFREQESAVLADVAKGSRQVISCGGGVVTRERNYDLLHQNSLIVMLDRRIDELSGKGRPITQRDGIEALARQRLPLYRAWADHIVKSRASAAETAAAVAAALPPML